MKDGGLCFWVRALLAGPTGIRQLLLLESRQQWDIEDLLAGFPTVGQMQVARAVLSYCQSKSVCRAFPVHPEDDLYKIFGATEEELAETTSRICEMFSIDIPTGSRFLDAKIRTVKQLIDFIHSCRRLGKQS